MNKYNELETLSRLLENNSISQEEFNIQKNKILSSDNPKKKNVVLAVILTFLIAGTGHMYLGQIGKGFLFLLGTGFATILMGAIGWAICIILLSIDVAYAISKENN